jgi:hypothetical protein
VLPPEIIKKIRKEKEQRDRPAAQIPLHVPEIRSPDEHIEEQEEKTDRVIVIDLA